MAWKILEESGKCGLNINLSETNYMIIRDTNKDLYIDKNITLKRRIEYTYQGYTILTKDDRKKVSLKN